MKVSFYGTRGSVPVASANTVRYGGNTTCVRIESDSIPDNQLLVVDAGSGFVPLGRELIAAGIQMVHLLFTHYHHDHTQGLPLCPFTFIPTVRFNCIGPLEHGVDPLDMLRLIMKQPLFPVEFVEIASRFKGVGVENPAGTTLLYHREGGSRLIEISDLNRAEGRTPSHIRMEHATYPVSECLVVKMVRTNHPERTMTYRFEERSTGRVFVFVTDHENLDGYPAQLVRHMKGADLLVMDSQYSRHRYDTMTAGFGHATPDYCVKVAQRVGAARLGLTHHDPASTDQDIDSILEEARRTAQEIGYDGEVLALSDYESLEV